MLQHQRKCCIIKLCEENCLWQSSLYSYTRPLLRSQENIGNLEDKQNCLYLQNDNNYNNNNDNNKNDYNIIINYADNVSNVDFIEE